MDACCSAFEARSSASSGISKVRMSSSVSAWLLTSPSMASAPMIDRLTAIQNGVFTPQRCDRRHTRKLRWCRVVAQRPSCSAKMRRGNICQLKNTLEGKRAGVCDPCHCAVKFGSAIMVDVPRSFLNSRNSSGSLAMFAAIRVASSRVDWPFGSQTWFSFFNGRYVRRP